MPERNTRGPAEYGWVAASVLILVLLRSAAFVCWPQTHFDSDQAVTGLMAKHLSEGRAFPVFWYGQSYMLAVEAWLAAPVFLVLGATVTALKLPLVAMNLAIALLTLRALVREVGLRPLDAGLATSFFALAAPIASAHFLTANGGNVEPLLYVLLLWYTRGSAIWLGLVLGIGFLNREFTIYGALALVALEAFRRTLWTRAAIRRYSMMLVVAALVWAAAQLAKQFSSAAGPGTSVADLYSGMPSTNIGELLHRTCLNPSALAAGVAGLFREHYPQLFGTYVQPLVDFGIESAAWEGMRGASVLLALVAAVAAARVGQRFIGSRDWPRAFDFCGYLLLVSLLSAAGYISGRCGEIALPTMRYELLSVLGLVALAALYLRVEWVKPLRWIWIAAASTVLAVGGAADARLLAEYVHRPPVAQKQLLIQALRSHGVHYAYADFWVAYYVTFLTRERVVVAADDAVRIRTLNRIVDAHRDRAVRISRARCAGGEQLTAAFWSCRP